MIYYLTIYYLQFIDRLMIYYLTIYDLQFMGNGFY